MLKSDNELRPYGNEDIAGMLELPPVVEAAIRVDALIEYLRQPNGSLSSELSDKAQPQVADLLFLNTSKIRPQEH